MRALLHFFSIYFCFVLFCFVLFLFCSVFPFHSPFFSFFFKANKTLNPDLGTSCTTGHYRGGIYPETHRSMLLKNTSGLPALEPWSKCHIYDFVQPSVQSYWTEMCLNMTDSGVIDGCGADASWQIDPTGGTTAPDVEKEWDVGHRTMMRDTTLALGDGVLLGKDPWELDYHVNGTVLHCPVV